MVGGFIRWDRLFEGSPTQDGKEVVERGAFAPVVEYDDQTHAVGLPGLITEPWQGMKRWLNGGAEENVARMRTGLPFTPEAVGDAFTVAGSAALGSVAAPRPSGAYVTSGAPMKPSHLPMDEASRMARAKEMGFDTEAFHVTGADFDEFRPHPYRGASFFAMTPEDAIKGAAAGANDMTGTGTDRTMRVLLPGDEIFGLSLTPTEKKWWDSLPSKGADDGDGGFVEGALASRPDDISVYGKNMPWYYIYDEARNADGTFSYNKLPMPRLDWKQASSTNRDVYGNQFSHYGKGSEKFSSEEAKRNGMSGFAQQDEAGLAIGIVDPRRIRSVDAAFDPAKADSADLLAANPKEAAALGAAVQGERPDDEDMWRGAFMTAPWSTVE